MIYHELFSQHLRLGNFLFKYAWSIAKYEQLGELSAYPHEYYLWKYLRVPPLTKLNYTETIPNSDFLKVNWEWSKEEEKRIDDIIINGKSTVVSLDSFFQSERWFKNYKNEVWKSLQFKDDVKEKVYCKHLYLFQRPTIGIGIRLGDFIGHGDFYQIDPDWYISALEKHFWLDDYNIVIFSDDIKMAKEIFKDYPDFLYAEPNGTQTHADNFKYYHGDASEQFILGTMMDNWIIGNSTFSWWQAWLATYNKSGKVIHSGKVFSETGNMKHIDTSNYYPKNWIKHEI